MTITLFNPNLATNRPFGIEYHPSGLCLLGKDYFLPIALFRFEKCSIVYYTVYMPKNVVADAAQPSNLTLWRLPFLVVPSLRYSSLFQL